MQRAWPAGGAGAGPADAGAAAEREQLGARRGAQGCWQDRCQLPCRASAKHLHVALVEVNECSCFGNWHTCQANQLKKDTKKKYIFIF